MPTIRTLLSLLLVCLFSACGVDQTLRKADKLWQIGEYADAAAAYRKVYQQLPSKEKALKGAVSLQMARCYNQLNAIPRALAAYQTGLRYGQPTLHDRLTFARLLLKAGQYQNATRAFEALKDSLPNDPLWRNGLLSAQQAAAWKAQKSHYRVKPMASLNSPQADYAPMLLPGDTTQLYFTSSRKTALGNELNGVTGTKSCDIFFTQLNDKGTWSRPEPVVGAVNSAYEDGTCTFSPDGQTMFFTRCTIHPSQPRYAQIWTAQRHDATWSNPQPLRLSRDTLATFAHPAVSPDGKWLYFVSDLPGGQGGLDLWRAQLTLTGIGFIENLGAPINTAGNEMFPTFRTNGDLYFSSDGHPGLGGLDLFCATFKPHHEIDISRLPAPVNSSADDFGMTFEGHHMRGFFASNRNDAHGYDHLYRFECPDVTQTIQGWVYERDGYELPQAQVYLVGNDGTNEKLSVHGNGAFTKVVKPGVDYLLLATCDGFLNHQEALHIDTIDSAKVYTLQFPLASIQAPVLIDNIFYAFDKATLLPESTAALDQLVALLNENPHVTIELSAHCDDRGSALYNQRLSQQRAENVVRYLVAHGIQADRLTAVGYGKSKPKIVPLKLTERYPWLKAGDVLSETFIASLDNAQQAVCNQLNRRTEFRVLRTTYGLFDAQGKSKESATKPIKKLTNTNTTEKTF
jgi:ompA family protein